MNAQKKIQTIRKITAAVVFIGMLCSAVFADAQHVVRATCAKQNPAEVQVKWFVDELYNKEGFNVYRKESGAKEWTKVNKSPILKQENIEQKWLDADKELKSFVETANQSFPAPLPGMVKLFVLLKTMQSEPFARFMGITTTDVSVLAKKTYTYKVTRLKNGIEEDVGISNEVTAGAYKPEPAPSAFAIEVKKKKTEMLWQLEPERLYAFNVYKGVTNSANAMTKMNERPILIFDATDEKGNAVSPTSFYTDEKVEEGKTYYYRLTGLDVFGNESESSPVLQTAVPDSTPPPPVDVLKAKADDKVLLNWVASQATDLKGYNIYWSMKSDADFKKLNSTPVTATSYEHAPGKKGVYFFNVTAVDNSGNESESRSAVAEIQDKEPPLAPKNLKAVADTGEVSLSWDATPSGDFWGYYVLRAANEDKPANFVRVNSEPLRVTTFIDKMPKEADNKLFYRILAMDSSAIESLPSEPVEIRMPDVTAPPPPFIKIIETAVGKNTIQWMPSLCSDLSGYFVYRATAKDAAQFDLLTPQPLATTVNSFTDEKIDSAEWYYYKVIAADVAGNRSAASNIYPAKTKQGNETAPAPQKVSVSYDAKKNAATLKWKVEQSAGLKGVMIYRAEEGGKFFPMSGLINDAQFSDTKISQNKIYAYQVRSLYENGVTGRSESIQFTTKQ